MLTLFLTLVTHLHPFPPPLPCTTTQGLLRISKRSFLTGEMVGRGGDWETWTDSYHHVPCFIERLSEWGLIGKH